MPKLQWGHFIGAHNPSVQETRPRLRRWVLGESAYLSARCTHVVATSRNTCLGEELSDALESIDRQHHPNGYWQCMTKDSRHKTRPQTRRVIKHELASLHRKQSELQRASEPKELILITLPEDTSQSDCRTEPRRRQGPPEGDHNWLRLLQTGHPLLIRRATKSGTRCIEASPYAVNINNGDPQFCRCQQCS